MNRTIPDRLFKDWVRDPSLPIPAPGPSKAKEAEVVTTVVIVMRMAAIALGWTDTTPRTRPATTPNS